MSNDYQTQEQIDACDYVTTIRWGIEEPFKEVTYGFKTKGEYWAFMMGVEQSNGWMEYEEVEEDVS